MMKREQMLFRLFGFLYCVAKEAVSSVSIMLRRISQTTDRQHIEQLSIETDFQFQYFLFNSNFSSSLRIRTKCRSGKTATILHYLSLSLTFGIKCRNEQ